MIDGDEFNTDESWSAWTARFHLPLHEPVSEVSLAVIHACKRSLILHRRITGKPQMDSRILGFLKPVENFLLLLTPLFHTAMMLSSPQQSSKTKQRKNTWAYEL